MSASVSAAASSLIADDVLSMLVPFSEPVTDEIGLETTQIGMPLEYTSR
ncbi:hypothetical protein [Paramicrobacterium fandaimingii]|nr:hypothetical protein [Microbacterium fandaimingii]